MSECQQFLRIGYLIYYAFTDLLRETIYFAYKDIVERSIRDVLAIVPDDLKPHKNGILVQARSYEAYISKVSF